MNKLTPNGLHQKDNSNKGLLRRFLTKDYHFDKMMRAAIKGVVSRTAMNSYGDIFGQRTRVSDRDVPAMLSDAVVGSAVGLLMETAFQPSPQQSLFEVQSKYSVVKEELENWHDRINADEFCLTAGYNLVAYGNLPVELLYSQAGQLEHISFEPDYTAVTPLKIYNTNVGFMYDGKYREPFDFVYGQLLFYRDLGGTRSQQWLWKQGTEFNNEFTYAPSYLSAAYRPYKTIKMIEDVLLLMRLDQANFRRLLMVNVGDNVYSGNAAKLYHYYRSLIKKARRVTFDSDGVMGGQGIGNDFEIVIPKSSRQGVEVQELKGEVDVRSLKDLDQQYNRLFASLRVSQSMLGFSTDSGGVTLNSESPATVWDKRFARTAKSVVLSTSKMLEQIDYYYLRSRGYDVHFGDWSYSFTSVNTLEEVEKQNALKQGVENMSSVAQSLTELGLEFDPAYLARSYLGSLLSNMGMDIDKLLGPGGGEGNNLLLPATASLLMVDRQEHVFPIFSKLGLISESNAITLSGTPSLIVSYNDYLSSPDSYLSSRSVEVQLPVSIATIDKTTCKQKRMAFKDFAATKLYSDISVALPAQLEIGKYKAIQNLYYIPGEGIYLEGEDLFNYLYMVSQNMESIPIVNSFLVVDATLN